MKENNEYKKWSTLINKLDEIDVHLDHVVFDVLNDLKHHNRLNECYSDDVKYAILYLEEAQHFCTSSRDSDVVVKSMDALNHMLEISLNMERPHDSVEFCDEQENRIDEIRAINPELADAINEFINSIASHQDIITIYHPSLSGLLIQNMSLLKEAINAAWHKSIKKREETILFARKERFKNRKLKEKNQRALDRKETT